LIELRAGAPQNSDSMSAPSQNDAINQRPAIVVETLGCKVNLFESEYISNQLHQAGEQCGDGRDICIINTCTVTREADRQSRQAIRRTIRHHPDATIIVTGCYAEIQPAECASIPGVDYVVPGSRKLQIPRFIRGEIAHQSLLAPASSKANVILPDQAIAGFEARTRANLQVQQGCDNGCTFCIIHQARGPSRSIPPTTVIRQVEQYVSQGFAEIVICGIDLGSYGDDLCGNSPISLSRLIAELATRYPACRFRLSSIDPAHITPNLISAMQQHDNICPHIHLSLQSASPLVLKRMKRRYGPDQVYDVVAALRKANADLVLSADIMAGFPTESDADFERTKQAIVDLEIAYPHVFAYSERNNTPAARIPRQIPVALRKRRAQQLRETGDAVRKTVLHRFIGRCESALAEGRVSGTDAMFRSRLANYLPVYFFSHHDVSGQWVELQLTDIHRDGLLGVLQSR